MNEYTRVVYKIPGSIDNPEICNILQESQDLLPEFQFKTKPRKHQLATWNLSKNREYFAIFHEPRTGKTKIVLDTATYLFSEGKIKVLIYIAPSGTIGEILDTQIHLHMDESLYTVHRIRLAKLPEIKHTYNKLLILGINVEALSHKRGVDFLENILRSHDSVMIVVDESTTISSPRAIRTKAIIKLGRLAKYKRIMTGTPIADSVLDLPSQIEFLGPLNDLLGVKNWYLFRARYCEIMPVSYGHRQFIRIGGPRRLEELLSRIHPYSSFATLEEVRGELPDRTYQKYQVSMDPKTEKAYKEMSKNLITHVESKECSATTVTVKLIRLLQIVSGFIKDEDGIIQGISDIRYKGLLELIKTLTGKIVIWSVFTYSIDKICELLGNEYGENSVCRYDGKLFAMDREKQLSKFKDEKECRFFVSNVRVGGYGLNLSCSETAIYFHNLWSVENRIQSENRIMSLESKVLYIDMVMPGIDEKILNALQTKKNLIKEILTYGVGV